MLGWIHSWRVASSGVIRFFGSHLQRQATRTLMSTRAPRRRKRYLLQTSAHKVDENRIIAAQSLRQRLRSGLALAVLRVGDAARIAARVEEQPPPRGLVYHVFGRHVQHLHDARELLDLVLARKERIPGVQFRQNTACGKRSPKGNTRERKQMKMMRNVVERRFDGSVMLPKLHISIGVPYDSPKMTSGER